MALSRVLRHFLRSSKGFVASVVVPEGTNIHPYSAAAHRLLGDPFDGAHIRNPSDVIVIKDDPDLSDITKLTRYNGTRRVIILLAFEEWVTDDVRLLSDVTAALPRPTAMDIKIAAKRMGFGRIGDADAEFLMTHDITRLSLMMRRGRSVDAMIARLRRYPTPPEAPAPDNADPGPTLHDLHGFGPAATWGTCH
ncbi:hypothetical protein LJR235_002828 [Pararhizobium sp. LjRoot235]|uniref:hypothetical protein n=1 Tax=Pararhizobium sp. LjRoot235 TaxID=3342291 RepID=UPI003ED0E495